MEVWQQRAATGQPLADAYLVCRPDVMQLYDHDVSSEEFARIRMAELDRLFADHDRAALVAALREYGQSVTGLSDGQEALLAKLADPRCLVVVTGQQAGLFTGPLYTLYKALSAVVSANRLEKHTGRPVVPVFWVASEDHDFDEVASAWYIRGDGKLARAQLRERPPARTPVGLHAVSKTELDRLLSELEAGLSGGMYKQDLLRDLEDTYKATANMADWCTRLLALWLRDTPLLFVNPMRADVRRIVRDAFARALACPRELRDAAFAGARRIDSLGFAPPVEVHDRHTLLYLIDGGRRSAIDLVPDEQDMFELRDSRRRFGGDELRERLENRPQDFSAGVLYRPVVQDFLLPVLAYVGGPSEIAYHGMMGDIFRVAGRSVPPLLLRMRALGVPRAAARALERYGFTLEDALFDDPVARYLQKQVEPPVSEVTGALARAIEEELAKREEYYLSLGDSMVSALQKTRESLTVHVCRLGLRAEKTLRLRHEEAVRALGSAANWLRPEGSEQERLLSPLSFISQYGTSWIGELARRASADADAITVFGF